MNLLILVTVSLIGNAMDFRHDVNGDCVVNVLDIMVIRANLGREGSSIVPTTADVNRDGVCNMVDLLAVRSQLGTLLERVSVSEEDHRPFYFISAYESGSKVRRLWHPEHRNILCYVGQELPLVWSRQYLSPVVVEGVRFWLNDADGPALFASIENAEKLIKVYAWHNKADMYEVQELRVVSRWKITRDMGFTYPWD